MIATLDLIIAAIIAALPTIASVIGIIKGVCSNKKHTDEVVGALQTAFEETKAEVVKTKEYENLKAQYESMSAQYYSLLKAHRELLTAIDKVVRKEEDYEGKSDN